MYVYIYAYIYTCNMPNMPQSVFLCHPARLHVHTMKDSDV